MTASNSTNATKNITKLTASNNKAYTFTANTTNSTTIPTIVTTRKNKPNNNTNINCKTLCIPAVKTAFHTMKLVLTIRAQTPQTFTCEEKWRLPTSIRSTGFTVVRTKLHMAPPMAILADNHVTRNQWAFFLSMRELYKIIFDSHVTEKKCWLICFLFG
jgi:hypothetical protein